MVIGCYYSLLLQLDMMHNIQRQIFVCVAYLGWVSYLFVILICTRFISHLGLSWYLFVNLFSSRSLHFFYHSIVLQLILISGIHYSHFQQKADFIVSLISITSNWSRKVHIRASYLFVNSLLSYLIIKQCILLSLFRQLI